MAKSLTEIRSAARTHTDLAIRTLKEVCSSKQSPPNARVSAAVALLDRGWGKPEQYIDVTSRTVREISDAELIAIAAGSSEGAAEAPKDKSELH